MTYTLKIILSYWKSSTCTLFNIWEIKSCAHTNYLKSCHSKRTDFGIYTFISTQNTQRHIQTHFLSQLYVQWHHISPFGLWFIFHLHKYMWSNVLGFGDITVRRLIWSLFPGNSKCRESDGQMQLLRPYVRESVIEKCRMLWECGGRNLNPVFWNRKGFLWGSKYNMRGRVCVGQKNGGDIVPERWNFVSKAVEVRERDMHSEKYNVFH